MEADLAVKRISAALGGLKLDVIVSGSIGAVESIKFIRALRRLGATVTPWLTRGGSMFVTEMSLAWAAAADVRTDFSGDASHLALGDACVVAPASLNFLTGIARGDTDSPARALVASYLGQKKPVLMVPNMHGSLARFPEYAQACSKLSGWGVNLLEPRQEEGKNKFPEPAVLADQVAHAVNGRLSVYKAGALVTMGTTRGYLDDVRYISNYSSGALGSAIATELYRWGIATTVVAGPCPVMPAVSSALSGVTTHEEMQRAAQSALSSGCAAAVLAASVLDFEPAQRTSGKIPTAGNAELTVTLKRTPKIIAAINPTSAKVGFKLETGLTPARADQLAADYMNKYNLTMFVINDLADVSRTRHTARVFVREGGQPVQLPICEGKGRLARLVADHVRQSLTTTGK